MTDRDRLILACDNAPPGDFAPFGVAADYLDENGEADLAAAFRWCWAKCRRPRCDKHARGRQMPYSWYRQRKKLACEAHYLERSIFCLMRSVSLWASARTFHKAMMELADALAALRKMVLP